MTQSPTGPAPDTASPDTASGDTASDPAAPQEDLASLEARICELAGHLAAATQRFLVLVGEYDAREGWATWEQPSCAAWLAWKCQISPGAAREHVRVARALRGLPAVSKEFAAGRMSYAKARALTRIATPETEAALVDLAGPMTAGQMERFAAAHRRVDRASEPPPPPARRLTFRVQDDGQLTVSIKLPAEDGAMLLQALRAATGQIPAPQPGGPEPAEQAREAGGDGAAEASPLNQRRNHPAALADGLVDILSDYLRGKIDAASDADIYQVIVHVGDAVLTGDNTTGVPADGPSAPADGAGAPAGGAGAPADGPRVPPQDSAEAAQQPGHPANPRRCHLEDGPAVTDGTAARLACGATFSWMLHAGDGSVLDVGRRQRRPPPALRRAVRERDGYRCAYPGCNTRRTDVHHIVHWARGGATSLANLTSLCRTHHVVVHERGLALSQEPGGTLRVSLPDGTLVPAAPPLPGGEPDLSGRHGAAITADTIQPYPRDKLDLDFAIWACFAHYRIAEERRKQQEEDRQRQEEHEQAEQGQAEPQSQREAELAV